MSHQCLNCGKPLGSESALCYSCRSDGISPADVVSADPEIKERVERYFILSSVKCANCDELHGTVTVDGQQYTAADFGIDDLEAWQLEMDNEEEWIRSHAKQVRAVLPELEDEWPHSAHALRTHVL